MKFKIAGFRQLMLGTSFGFCLLNNSFNDFCKRAFFLSFLMEHFKNLNFRSDTCSFWCEWRRGRFPAHIPWAAILWAVLQITIWRLLFSPHFVFAQTAIWVILFFDWFIGLHILRKQHLHMRLSRHFVI